MRKEPGALVRSKKDGTKKGASNEMVVMHLRCKTVRSQKNTAGMKWCGGTDNSFDAFPPHQCYATVPVSAGALEPPLE